MRRISPLGIALFLLVAFFSCQKEPIKSTISVCFGGNKMAILCEGNYMWGNSRLDLFLRDSGKCIENVFEKANNKPIGDVLQGGWFNGSSLWLAVNNSGNILKIDANSFKQQKLNTNMGSPRYILEHGAYLFVSDLYQNKISILDTASLAVVKQISVVNKPKNNIQGWSEFMVEWNNRIAISLMGGGVKLINPSSLETDSILTDTGASRLVVDNTNRLWVLTQNGKSGKLSAYNSNKELVKQFEFSCLNGASKLTINKEKNELLLILNNKITQISIDANSWSESKVIFGECRTAYGLGVDPVSGHLFVADAKDFVSNGIIFEITPTGQVVRQFPTGVNPSEFIFY